ncbi:MAG TPA: CDP-diacylglycerol--glycerol-3-phosphate 3-phosphatidyltransferase [Candidatus Acidoferrales bacterium]|jgi:CDP-diacylglycerol--glycerol-3-phosphate 3-phosphatidyltransferase|nr:CDP-diacylglycerol--glycerol-3-phosphate 3-phosphatidyltransferase [Candidatus Acidoferrales bacterium]
MNLPNKLTSARFGLTVLFVWALFTPIPFHNTLAFVLFNIASLTDFLDGKIARSRGLITNFGILMDSLADKILTCSAFIAFVQSTHVNPYPQVTVYAWMVIIIVAREFAITGMRLLAASKSIVLASENFGKHKTVSQIAAINALLLLDACQEWPLASQQFIQKWLPPLADIMLWLAVILTATSGALYLWRNRALYLNDM